MSRQRTIAACLASVLGEQLPRIAMPVDVTDATRFPLIAEASRWFAGLPAEQREQIEKEWNDD